MTRTGLPLLLLLCLFLYLPAAVRAEEQLVFGRVLDALTDEPLAGALLSGAGASANSDADGRFELLTDADSIAVKLPGYRRTSLVADPPLRIKLIPFSPKALYLSVWGVASGKVRRTALQLLQRTELNGLVIDLKEAQGFLSFRSRTPLAQQIGARRHASLSDLVAFVAGLKRQGIYLIARITVFKDHLLASARPELAVMTDSGEPWQSPDGLLWTAPFKQQVRDYNLAIAEEAAAAGFDEIQFDYLRFPDILSGPDRLRFSRPNTEANRVAAIGIFLEQARQRLAPYNVFISVATFGYVCWNRNDTWIGQRLVDLAPLADYITPMLYPSSFQRGIPQFTDPVKHPFEVVALSLAEGRQLSGLPGVRFRPWLQAFRDYAYDRRPYAADEIGAQISAAEAQGSNGWMLWNAANNYTSQGLSELLGSDLSGTGPAE